MNKEKARKEIKVLVEKFDRLKASGEIKKFNEERTKNEFIEPLFEALGWDMRNRFTDNEVTKEEKVSKGRADFGFRINNIPKFFVEAKPIKVNIEDTNFIKQAINYAWNKGTTWAILTNFENLIIFNAEWISKSIHNNKFIPLNYKNYISDFDLLYLISKEAIINDELNKKAEKVGKKSKRKPIDRQLFEDFTKWRALLTENIIKNNKDFKLTEDHIDEIVQRILDRLIFIRKCEDLRLEEKKLLALEHQYRFKKEFYHQLIRIFKYYDSVYNSHLFSKHLCDDERLIINYKAIGTVINELYHDKTKTRTYDFSAIDADILGSMYEQYLGYILKKRGKGAKVESDRIHRKELGIYYTPIYIVDYIVRNTLGKVLEKRGKNIDQIKILDPACGSGSFLIKTFDLLSEFYKKKLGEDKLGSVIRSGILTKNIYGVDLDAKAVEIAQLNLFLKIAEKRERLPLLQDNIKCGNSLIDDEKVAGDKSFKWKEEFPEIMKDGGFDIIIGNPPYFTMQSSGSKIQKYFETSDRWKDVYRGQSDILYYFIIHGLKLLKEGGYLGFITSRYWLENKWADKLRKFILNNAKIIKIIDFRNFYVFADANIHTCIVLLQKETDKKKRESNQLEFTNILTDNKQVNLAELSFSKSKQEELTDKVWILSEKEIKELLDKIENKSSTLESTASIGKGYDTGLNEVFEIRKDSIEKYNLEKELLVKDIKNGNVRRYKINYDGLQMIYITKDHDINKYPNTLKYLSKFKNRLTNRYAYKHKQCTWFSLSTLRNRDLFDKAKVKIVTPYLAPRNTFALDDVGYYNGGSEVFIIVVKDKKKVDHKYLLGLLNSKLLTYYMSRVGKKKGNAYRYSTTYLKGMPIKIVSKEKQKPVIKLVDKMISLNKKLFEIGDKKTSEKEKVEKQIRETDVKIDELVYEFYNLTKDEIKIIEDSLK